MSSVASRARSRGGLLLVLVLGLVAGPGSGSTTETGAPDPRTAAREPPPAQRAGSEPPPLSPEAELAAEGLALEGEGEELPEAHDPLEPMNRAVFGANRVVDRFALEPVARAYGWLVPDPGKRAVTRVFDNLNAPVVLVNDLLQLEPGRAARTGARFVLNTTLGVAGLFDVARHAGLAGHSSDFGETLGRAGVGPGAYLVLPLLGPSTLRDAIGQLVDAALRPDTWLLSPGGRMAVATTGGVTRREAHLVELEELERSSVDFYATLRSVYLMHRERVLWDEDG